MSAPRRRALWLRAGLSSAPVVAIAAFVLWAHFGSGVEVFRAHVSSAPGWQQFRASYGVDSFGADGYFTRAVKHGYNLFYYTPQYGERFTPPASLR